MKTLIILPDLSTAQRFATQTFGRQQLEIVRDEHVALAGVVALLCGTTPDRLSLEVIAALRAQLIDRRRVSDDAAFALLDQATETLRAAVIRADGRQAASVDVARWALVLSSDPDPAVKA